MAGITNPTWAGYDDWYKQVLDSGQYWNDADLYHASQDQNFADQMYGAKSKYYTAQNDYKNAPTDEAKALAQATMTDANNFANNLRSGYNYTSGLEGSEYNPFGNQNNSKFWGDEMLDAYGNIKGAPSFTYEKFQAPDPFTYEDFQAPDPFTYDPYQNDTPEWQHSDIYNNALDNVINYGDFSYDYTTDPLYDVYAKEYTREGRRASEDALAQAAAMTGGVPSSYANMVGQQAGNYYASQLADKIPELRAQAYNEWQNNYNNLLSKYNVANGHDTFDYGVYSDKLNRDYQQYKDDLNMRYGIYSDDYNRAYNQWADKVNLDYGIYSDDYNRAYQQWQDQVNLDHAINNENYQRLLDTYGMANDNFNLFHGEDREDAAAADAKRLDYAKLLAQFGDYSGLDEYYGGNGKLTNLYAQMQAAKARGSGSGKKTKPTLTMNDTEFQKLIEQAYSGGDAAGILSQYWDYMDSSQKALMAAYAGIDIDSMKEYGGVDDAGADYFAALSDIGKLTETNAIDAYVRNLPAGLTEAELDSYINSNADFKNNAARNSAKALYNEIHGLTGPALPPLEETIAGLGGGLSKGEVKTILDDMGYDSGAQSNGWEIYDTTYGFNYNNVSDRAKGMAAQFPGVNASQEAIDAWKTWVSGEAYRLSIDDQNYLLSLAEGWGDYKGYGG